MRLRFSDVKAQCAKVLNVKQSDSRVLTVVNEACERLLYEMKSVGTVTRYNVCVASKCLTWPREVETIEAAAFCKFPVVLRNGWYEFLGDGPGIAGDCGPCLTLIDRGNAIAFDDVTGTGKKLAIYADGTEDPGQYVLLRYYDYLGNKTYTQFGGETIEGEMVPIPAAGGYSYTQFLEVLPYGLYEVIKPVTKRVIRLYEYTVNGGALKPLAYYEPDEELPVYRRSYIPCLENSGDDCGTMSVTIAAKLRFIPATGDNSILSIANRGAIRLGVQAVKKEEDNLLGEAAMYWQQAIRAMDKQLEHWQGDGVVAPIKVDSAQCYDGAVLNLI